MGDESEFAADSSPLAIMGVGELPVTLRRFNWGAFLLPGWWSLLHGLRLPWLVRLGMACTWLILVSLIRRFAPQAGALPQLAVLAAVYAAADSVVALLFGLRGNAWVWKHQVSRTAKGARRRLVSQYVWGERVWMLVGAALFPFGIYGIWENVRDHAARIVGGASGGWVWIVGQIIALAAAVVVSRHVTASRELPHA